ncbi:MAG TPA: 50S ribosomal protein L6 [Nitrospiria bacterium]|nr:50S ribosomal protein L6 [Nitrospiria bacterium]HUK57545.1 50S ribosomal protein L6 [Nitrospiria bacterium]
MSRVGKKPILVPSGVQVKVEEKGVRIKGPKGELTRGMEMGIGVTVEDGRVVVTRRDDDRLHRAKHGLFRSDLNNMVIGVSQGYQKSLEISGVGFRAQVQGRNLTLALGFSHPTVFALPTGIEATVDKQTLITIKGADKYLVGQVAAEIRDLKLPEPYKGKGIKYAGEVIERKEGKTSK